MSKNQLIVHAGGQVVPRDAVFEVVTPDSTDTWFPVSHGKVLTSVQAHLETGGYQISSEQHCLSHEGNRYFGILTLASERTPDYTWAVGLRNSHDKTFPAGLSAGTRVFVCDNLAFNGEITVSRKHTRFIMRDFEQLTLNAVGKLANQLGKMDDRVERYKNHTLDDLHAHDLMVRAIAAQVIPLTRLQDVLREWREPQHTEFQVRNLWSFFNAITETFKGVNPDLAIKRGGALHGLLDSVVGLLD